MRRRAVVPLAILFAVVACRKAEAPLGARDSTFVATMVELRRIPAGTPADSITRNAVLRRRRVTPGELEAVASELAADPARAVRVWRQIDAGAAAAPAPPPAPPPITPDSARPRPRGRS